MTFINLRSVLHVYTYLLYLYNKYVLLYILGILYKVDVCLYYLYVDIYCIGSKLKHNVIYNIL